MSASQMEAAAAGMDGSERSWMERIAPDRPGPIRGELLGVGRLEQSARALADAAELAGRRSSSPLLKRFEGNAKVLEGVHARILRGEEHARGIDVEWLLDNFHIVDEVLKEVRRDMPRGYDAVLPKLATTPLKGYPRVYAIAAALAAHTDAEFDEAKLDRFVAAFQERASLTIGELWALPTMLRLILLEDLRRLADEMAWSWRERARADAWLAAGADRPPLEDLNGPFVLRLVQAPRAVGSSAPAAKEVVARLRSQGVDVDAVVEAENARQAANQVTVGNCVVSLRLLSAVDWNAFFEQQSAVQKILLEDPSGFYIQQDFATCDRCRKAVEKVARGAKADEREVARRAVELATGADPADRRRRCVAYWLIDDGLKELRTGFPYRGPWRERLLEWSRLHPNFVYFGSIAAAWLIAAVGFVWTAGGVSLGVGASLVVLALAAAPIAEAAVGFVNHALTLLLPPRRLAKLEFKKGIPDEYQTFVVIPTMLVKPHHAAALLERLEIHYLSNPDSGLRFALLTDFADAPSEQMPDDRALIDDALRRVRDLNARYVEVGGEDLFYIFHRRRIWNPSQGAWMGWERKRGKLSEFNRILRGGPVGSYDVLSADPSNLPHFRYVVTLDSDTQMPRDTATRLVGTIAHPLNRPKFDPETGRVLEGYGVLQPRVSFHLTAATHSYFARLLASGGGIDPYSTAASDSYMDLYGIGSFTGKGVYDVDAFEHAVGDIFPENRILSHDLIEGNYARCGLLSDTEVFDDFPARYHAYARREHRWIRGDWQLLPWLGRTVPLPGGGSRPNPLPILERWKLLDNLRRSLSPPAVVLMLALGWTVAPGSPWLWTALALLVQAQPVLKWLAAATVGAIRSGSLGPFKGGVDAVPSLGGQSLLSLAFLPDQARQAVDAIVRTLYRSYVSRERMLEWETAASTEQRLGGAFSTFVRSMWPASATAVLMGAASAWLRPSALWAAGPILLAWLLSPLIAYLISRPLPATEEPISDEQRRALRRLARKTWRYFETFVGEEDHWLPPDNFQEIPDGRVAHRTSPTNKGLLLISTLAANDLGYLPLGTMLDRLEKTFDTLDRLERRWGHFYNWYQTQTLEPLPPLYVSTVDSGNMLGCLVALRRGLLEKLDAAIIGPEAAAGLADALNLAMEDGGGLDGSRLKALTDAPPSDLPGWRSWLDQAEREAERLNDAIVSESDRGGDASAQAKVWARKTLEQAVEHRRHLDSLVGDGEGVAAAGPPPSLSALATDRPAAALLARRLRDLAARAEAMGRAMDFRPLYKKERDLYAIGCNLSQERLDGACYDLLASESCLTSYLTIARGDAPRKHWFQLGRPFVRAAGRIGLISWGGTMFEYLMPRLLLKSLPATVLSEACRTAVARQIEYGGQLGLPWGISESAFAAQYADGDYRYQAFGTPGLGLKQGLDQDRVIAPYATAMATMIDPASAVENLKRLTAEGAEGAFGWYEAIDFTPSRLAADQRSAVVRSYMSHHQGMSLVAAANVVLGDVMPRRFHSDPMVRAAELLLQERVPRDTPLVDLDAEAEEAAEAEAAGIGSTTERPAAPSFLSRRLTTPETASPRTHLLSNGRYHVMLTNAGSGASTCLGLDVTRWREDPAREAYGQFLYIRDAATGATWSAGFQPTCRPADEDEIVFAADKASFRRRDGAIESLMEVAVSPESFAEVRRLTLFNHGAAPRELDVTSYAEIVLTPHDADLAHPAFHKLSLETERLPGAAALLCRRRPRAAHEKPRWAVHVLAVDATAAGGSVVGEPSFETDRAVFLGRGRTAAAPAALDPGVELSGTSGPVLDPIFSLRRRLTLAPGGSISLAFTTAVAESRAGAVALADQYQSPSAAARAFELAWARRQAEHGQLGWSAEEAHLFQRLASHLIFAGPTLRASASAAASDPGLPGRFGVDARLPIVLLRLSSASEFPVARQAMAAQSYLRQHGLESELILLDDSTGPGLAEAVEAAARDTGVADRMGKPGGVHVVPGGSLSPTEREALRAVARAALDAADGPLAERIEAVDWAPEPPEPLVASPRATPFRDEPIALPEDLVFFNGLGGFTPDGREYVLRIDAPAGPPLPRPVLPPLPWSNVIANPGFGTLVTESGSQTTWAGNSQTNRLTSWSNDPVSDPSAEVLYLRDEEAGQVWCPTPLPIPSPDPTLVRHGQGWTTFERGSHGLRHRLDVFVDLERPIKYLRLQVENPGDSPRRLSATLYVEWVLGTTRDQSAMHVVTAIDPETGALTARNAFRDEFATGVAFLDVDRRPRTVTGDRVEFLGRHGSIAKPAALGQVELSGRVGPGLDPCGAVQSKFDLAPGEALEIVFLLGWADAPDQVREHLGHVRDVGAAEAFERSRAGWDRLLSAVQVRTPEPAFDLLVNRWLLYQVTSCRLWGRTAFYQSGGAFGFRDQLQDVLALLHAAPETARDQILLHASRQFVEGDAQHWWHPPEGRGVRTRCSDDFLWLPFVVSRYVEATGDAQALDADVPFLTAPQLAAGREDDYRLPEVAAGASLYEHCARALDRSSPRGTHGLPLIGGGDWNDGMNRIGIEGKGESVWLAWFLIVVLRRFAPIAAARGEAERADRWRAEADALAAAVEAHGWDGSWYRRAYFDDGEPLGTASASECRIDSLPQSWSVFAAAPTERSKRAMAAVETHLIQEADRLIQLLTPPFDHSSPNPGYIQGYIPGVRENGAQYTHAAAWVVQAFAGLGRGGKALEFFQFLNPINHATCKDDARSYKGEPYVVAGDVFALPPHAGRVGWSWYTGAAGWLYQAAVESILGIRPAGDHLVIDPCIPASWDEYVVVYRRGATTYRIRVRNPEGIEQGRVRVVVDGTPQEGPTISLTQDGRDGEINVDVVVERPLPGGTGA